MALQIISALLFTVFFSEALTLECYKCLTATETCTQTNCTSSEQCRYMSIYGGVNQKSCAASCASWSIHYEEVKVFSQCCTSDRCNDAPATDTDNALMCYTCSGTTCSKNQTLKCKGVENRCFNAAVGINGMNSAVKGCASQNICDNSALVNSLHTGLNVYSISCCGANLCNNMTVGNNAQSTTQGLFLLVPVLSLLFSI